MKPKINYDPKVNILSIKLSQKKSVDSDIKDNTVIDYAKDGSITNIDVMGININEFSNLNLLASHPFYGARILRDASKKGYKIKKHKK
ncbi:hypothetical protein CL633_01890 [bacterium]|nr:hypothetical protein [bacterium]|tara:strand:- start:9833 stop:10096 length:264 start_codon:yes stop_codon:yes gene_type:complete